MGNKVKGNGLSIRQAVIARQIRKNKLSRSGQDGASLHEKRNAGESPAILQRQAHEGRNVRNVPRTRGKR